ncbi:hypothetical protein NG726_14960 [Pseudomonas sp. MOB-449]|nr:hypothetical protein [Pseudomonas sp. MOB-449]
MDKLALHSPLHSWKKGQYPVNPFVYLSVGTHHEDDGRILLSAQLMTDVEIDHEVDSMIKELEEFRKKAKKELRMLRVKMLEK